MKTLIDKIITKLNHRADESFNHTKTLELYAVIDLIKKMEENASFKDIASLLVKYMETKCHPHSTTILTSINAELLRREKTTDKIIK